VLKNEEPARSRNEFIPEPNISFWGNDEVNTPELGELVRSSNWNRLNDIQGFYAGVYKNCGTTFLFCDRLGIYPLYYCIYDNRLFAAQRMLRLLETIPFTPTASKEGILSLLLFGHHISDETVFKEIRRCEGRVTL
jgi:asparagine synthetase B (glutamine-hydrolysing)